MNDGTKYIIVTPKGFCFKKNGDFGCREDALEFDSMIEASLCQVGGGLEHCRIIPANQKTTQETVHKAV